jgi:glycine/D-amino acid oxidase-like deaminating enzyme
VSSYNIIGGGLAGSITAKYLVSKGHTVRVFDTRDEHSASLASSNLFIRSWLKNLTHRKNVEIGLGILEDLYADAIEYPFAKGIGNAMQVGHIPQRDILWEDVIEDPVNIRNIKPGAVWTMQGKKYEADYNVWCIGWAANKLDPTLDMDIKVGHCVFLDGEIPEGESTIRIVSPYRHEKYYQYDDGTVYYADSVALKHSSYEKRKEEVLEQTRERAQKISGGMTEKQIRVGYRPITKWANFGVCYEYTGGNWIITGGGKNGMVAYAVAAEKLERETNAG